MEIVDKPTMIRLDFEIVDGDIKFRDCLNLTEAEYLSLSPVQITEMKKQRFNNWIAVLNAPQQEIVDGG